jgi:hypothetical protein
MQVLCDCAAQSGCAVLLVSHRHLSMADLGRQTPPQQVSETLCFQ